MKITIVTCSNAVNYGARLQCYALSRWLSEQGHAVEVVDYRPEYMDAQAPLLYWPGASVKEWAKLVLQFRTRIYTQRRINEFRKFSERWIPLTRMVYRASYDLRRYPPEADLYITGSDQVWNPTFRNGYDPIFYLDFGDKGVRRISYAASFGVDSIDNHARNFMKGYLRGLDAISVRERSGVEIINEIFASQDIPLRGDISAAPNISPTGRISREANISAVQVCDPAFLLTAEQWEEVMEAPLSHHGGTEARRKNKKLRIERIKQINSPCLRGDRSQTIGNNFKQLNIDSVSPCLRGESPCLRGEFVLVYDQMGSREIGEVAQAIAKERGLEIVSIGTRRLRYAKWNFLVEGPEVWLWLVRHAAVVVSNSFHACVFSIIFGREFLLVKRGDGLNSRMVEFLGELGLEDRIVEPGGRMPGGIDWPAVHGKLDPFIEQSKIWLNTETRRACGADKNT